MTQAPRSTPGGDERLRLRDSRRLEGDVFTLDFASLLDFHGGPAPGGVAHAFAAMLVALPRLTDRPDRAVDRRLVHLTTSFPGPGARDAFEAALRAVSDGRYTVDASLAQPDRGPVLAPYVFRFEADGRTAAVRLRDGGFVVPEFIDLSRRPERTAADEARLVQLKLEMTARILAAAPEEVYEPTETPE